MKATEHAKRHLAAMSPERREQLEAEWKGSEQATTRKTNNVIAERSRRDA
jgi:hypothetical protein